MIEWRNLSLEELAVYLSEELKKRDIDTVLVGGACVTIYSKNRYQSYDLDFVVYEDMKKVKKALKDLDFKEIDGYFKHDDCQWFIEFVSAPVAVGKEIISNFQTFFLKTGMIKMLRTEDSVKDRLASYFHWNDKQSLDQALEICKERKISMEEVENWAAREGFKEKFQVFKQRVKEIVF